MRLAWAVLLGVAGGIGVAWWLSRESPEDAHAKTARAAKANAARAADARPSLYRWRDDAGELHVTQTPPKKRRYERISTEPPSAIEVHGDRK
jgi:hypothetical protein